MRAGRRERHRRPFAEARAVLPLLAVDGPCRGRGRRRIVDEDAAVDLGRRRPGACRRRSRAPGRSTSAGSRLLGEVVERAQRQHAERHAPFSPGARPPSRRCRPCHQPDQHRRLPGTRPAERLLDLAPVPPRPPPGPPRPRHDRSRTRQPHAGATRQALSRRMVPPPRSRTTWNLLPQSRSPAPPPSRGPVGLRPPYGCLLSGRAKRKGRGTLAPRPGAPEGSGVASNQQRVAEPGTQEREDGHDGGHDPDRAAADPGQHDIELTDEVRGPAAPWRRARAGWRCG